MRDGRSTPQFIFFTCTAGDVCDASPGGGLVVGFASLDLSTVLGEAKNTVHTDLGVRK